MSNFSEINRLVADAHEKKEYRPVAVARITNSFERRLFVQSAHNTRDWSFPQGGIKLGEGAITALFREIYEEVGITGRNLTLERFLGYQCLDSATTCRNRRGFSKGKMYFFFSLRYEGDDILTLDPKEVADYRWVKEQNEISLLLSTTRDERREMIRRFL